MKTLIVSGFTEYGSHLVNLSERIVRTLHGKTFAGYRMVSSIFTCEIPKPENNRGNAILHEATRQGASGIVSLGMTSLSPGFWFETRARNLLHQPKYYPNEQNVLVDANRPPDEVLHPDLTPWRFDEVKDEIEGRRLGMMEASQDIGGFCCEHLVYEVLAAQLSLKERDRLPFTFLHLPCCPEAPRNPVEFRRSGKILLSEEGAIQGLEILLQKASL
ncbi:MAG: hypothetical protein Q7R64_03475 [bacterium]|nr:hypothetical protein [bacterium]